MQVIQLAGASVLVPMFGKDYMFAVLHVPELENEDDDDDEDKIAPPVFMQRKSNIEQALRAYKLTPQALLYTRFNQDESELHAWMNWNGSVIEHRGVRVYLSKREQRKLTRLKKKIVKQFRTNKTLNAERSYA